MHCKHIFKNFTNIKKCLHILTNLSKQAGAELGQAQVKLEVVDEVLAKA